MQLLYPPSQVLHITSQVREDDGDDDDGYDY